MPRNMRAQGCTRRRCGPRGRSGGLSLSNPAFERHVPTEPRQGVQRRFGELALIRHQAKKPTQGGHRNRVPVVKRPELVAEHLAVLGAGDVHAAGVSYVLGKSVKLVSVGGHVNATANPCASTAWHRPTTRYGRLVKSGPRSGCCPNDVPTNVPHPGSHPSPRIRWRPGPQLGWGDARCSTGSPGLVPPSAPPTSSRHLWLR